MASTIELLATSLTELAKVKPRDSASNTALSNGKARVREAKALIEQEAQPPTPEPPPPTADIRWGAWIDGSTYGTGGDVPWDQTTWNKFEEHAGKKVGIVHWGQPWGQLDSNALAAVKSRGAVSLLDHGIGSTTLQAVAEGGQDAVIDAWAQKAKSFGSEIIYRPWWEFNGTWYAWGRSPYYVAAWRRLYSRVKAIAPNVKFLWCPNVMWDTASDPAAWFPGESYVDYVGMDGYNAGPLKNTSWKSATAVFGPTYTKLRGLAPTKDIIIAETASTEQGAPSGTSKAAWIADFLGPVIQEQMPAVKAVCWFNWPIVEGGKTMDWPIESSSAAQAAFKAGIASAYFRAGA